MITVTILINGNPIITRSAVRNITGEPNEYLLDDGKTIAHFSSDGAVELAKKMLDSIDKDFLSLKQKDITNG